LLLLLSVVVVIVVVVSGCCYCCCCQWLLLLLLSVVVVIVVVSGCCYCCCCQWLLLLLLVVTSDDIWKLFCSWYSKYKQETESVSTLFPLFHRLKHTPNANTVFNNFDQVKEVNRKKINTRINFWKEKKKRKGKEQQQQHKSGRTQSIN